MDIISIKELLGYNSFWKEGEVDINLIEVSSLLKAEQFKK